MATTKGRVDSISVSKSKGTPKTNVHQAYIKANHGIVGDAHAGDGHRQVSLLSVESINRFRSKGVDVSPGDFAENITVAGMDLADLRVGCRLRIGDTAEIEVTQIGKRCHGKCAIFERIGDCTMPREGVFASAVSSGHITVGDIIETIHD